MRNHTPLSPPSDKARLPWLRLTVLSAAAFATVTAELLPASLLLQISDDFNVSEASTGLLVTAWALTVACASLPLVRLTARLPRHALLPLALLVLAITTAVTAIAPNYQLALVCRVIAAAAHGLFWSLLIPTAASLVPPALTGRAISVVLAGPALASVIGIPLGAAVGAGVGWRTAFALLAGLLLFGCLALRVLPLREPPSALAATSVRRDPALGMLIAVSVAGGLVLTGHFALYTYIAPLLRDLGGFDAAARATLLLIFGIGGLVGVLLSGRLSDRYPLSALTWVTAAFALSAASLALLSAGTFPAVTVLVVWGVLIGVLPPVFQTRLLRTASPGGEATAGAVGVTILNLGIAAGAAVGGLTVRQWSPNTLPTVSACVIALATALLLFTAAHARAAARRQPVRD